MRDDLQQELEEAGDNLRASFDDDVIADVIEEVDNLDVDRGSETADLLRTMTGIDQE